MLLLNTCVPLITYLCMPYSWGFRTGFPAALDCTPGSWWKTACSYWERQTEREGERERETSMNCCNTIICLNKSKWRQNAHTLPTYSHKMHHKFPVYHKNTSQWPFLPGFEELCLARFDLRSHFRRFCKASVETQTSHVFDCSFSHDFVVFCMIKPCVSM